MKGTERAWRRREADGVHAAAAARASRTATEGSTEEAKGSERPVQASDEEQDDNNGSSDAGPASESDWDLDAPAAESETPTLLRNGSAAAADAADSELMMGPAAPNAAGVDVASRPLPLGALEEGHIYFFYRPKVQQESPEHLDDVARFYIALQPIARRPPPTPEEVRFGSGSGSVAAAAADATGAGTTAVGASPPPPPAAAKPAHADVKVAVKKEDEMEMKKDETKTVTTRDDDDAGKEESALAAAAVAPGSGGGSTKAVRTAAPTVRTAAEARRLEQKQAAAPAGEGKGHMAGDAGGGDGSGGAINGGGGKDASRAATAAVASGPSGPGPGPPWPCRLLVIGKKHLPDPGRHERFFGFVDAVADRVPELASELLAAKHYSTRTRGERTQPAARVAGRGTYSIMMRLHGRRRPSTQLAYVLQLPQKPGPVQQELGIKRSARYVLNIKNPNRRDPGRPVVVRNPPYSPEQLEAFAGGTSWVGAEDVSLLDVPGAELLLIGAREQPLEETGEAAMAHLLDSNRRELQWATQIATQISTQIATRIAEDAEAHAQHVPAAGSGEIGSGEIGSDEIGSGGGMDGGRGGAFGEGSQAGEKLGGKDMEEETGREEAKRKTGSKDLAVESQDQGRKRVRTAGKQHEAKDAAGGGTGSSSGDGGGGGGGGDRGLVLAAMLRQELAAAAAPEATAETGAPDQVMTAPAETGEWA